MTEIPEQNYSPVWADDARTPPPLLADERATLTAFLDYHRETFLQKCSGVSPERLSERSAPPSTMTLHGLVRHLAAVERWWFQIQFAGDDVPLLYYSDDDPDQDFQDLSGDVLEVFDVWRRECARSSEITAEATSLEATGRRKRDGAPFMLRWLLLHMVAEYARHNGHADLLREGIDGATGS